jgi:hypothetical protein
MRFLRIYKMTAELAILTLLIVLAFPNPQAFAALNR